MLIPASFSFMFRWVDVVDFFLCKGGSIVKQTSAMTTRSAGNTVSKDMLDVNALTELPMRRPLLVRKRARCFDKPSLGRAIPVTTSVNTSLRVQACFESPKQKHSFSTLLGEMAP